MRTAPCAGRSPLPRLGEAMAVTVPSRPTGNSREAIAPPHSIEAEQSVLGAILISDRAMYALVIEEGLQPKDFYRERHGEIYAAMLALYEENEPIDDLT